MSSTLAINSPGVVAEIIDDEAILLNLEIGAYYSLNATGTEIWALVQEGGTAADAAAAMAARYPGQEALVTSQVERFLRTLLDEGLLVSTAAGTVRAEAPPASPQARMDYLPPAWTKYTDMQDLLLLDPIHEAGESGWPQAGRRDA